MSEEQNTGQAEFMRLLEMSPHELANHVNIHNINGWDEPTWGPTLSAMAHRLRMQAALERNRELYGESQVEVVKRDSRIIIGVLSATLGFVLGWFLG